MYAVKSLKAISSQKVLHDILDVNADLRTTECPKVERLFELQNTGCINALFNEARQWGLSSFICSEVFEKLDVTEVNIIGESIDKIGANFLRTKNFTRLSIGKNFDSVFDYYVRQHGPKHMQFLEAALNDFTRQNLRFLEVVSDDRASIFNNCIDDVLSFFPNLQKLVYRNVDSWKEMDGVVASPRKLKYLDLSFGSSMIIEDLVKNAPDLELLLVRDVPLHGDIKSLFKLKNLQVVDLSGCFSREQLDKFEEDTEIFCHPNLRFIEWSFNKSSEKVMEKLLQFCPNLRTIGAIGSTIPTHQLSSHRNALSLQNVETTVLTLQSYSNDPKDYIFLKLLDKMAEFPRNHLSSPRIIDEILKISEKNIKCGQVVVRCLNFLKAIWEWYCTEEPACCPFSSLQIVQMVKLLITINDANNRHDYGHATQMIWALHADLLTIQTVFTAPGVNQQEVLRSLHGRYEVSDEYDTKTLSVCTVLMKEFIGLQDKRGIVFSDFSMRLVNDTISNIVELDYHRMDVVQTEFLSTFMSFYKIFLAPTKIRFDEYGLETIAYREGDEDFTAETNSFFHFIRESRLVEWPHHLH